MTHIPISFHITFYVCTCSNIYVYVHVHVLCIFGSCACMLYKEVFFSVPVGISPIWWKGHIQMVRWLSYRIIKSLSAHVIWQFLSPTPHPSFCTHTHSYIPGISPFLYQFICDPPMTSLCVYIDNLHTYLATDKI